MIKIPLHLILLVCITIVLLVGKARLLLPGPMVFGQPIKHVEIHPKWKSLHLPQLYVVLFLTKQNMCQHHSSCVYLTWCSVKCQPSEPWFSLATGRPRGFATPFLTCSIKTEKEEVIVFYCIQLSAFFKKAK